MEVILIFQNMGVDNEENKVKNLEIKFFFFLWKNKLSSLWIIYQNNCKVHVKRVDFSLLQITYQIIKFETKPFNNL